MNQRQVLLPRNQYLLGAETWTYLAQVSQQRGTNNAFVDHNTMRLRSGTVICNVFSRNPPNTVYNHPLNRQCKPVKQSLTIELLKIDDADYYMEACTKYNKGVKEGWTDEQLFDMVTEIRRRPSKNEWEDECLL